MRIAFLSDVHGNLQALEAALEHVEGQSVDLIIAGGDIVNGAPESPACWSLLRSMGVPMLRGNHERYLFDLGTPREQPEWRSERFAMIRWARERFSEADLAAMRDLPMTLRLPEHPELLFAHASPISDNFLVHPYTPGEDLDSGLGEVSAQLLVRGHNHAQNLRRWRQTLVVSAGSVGMPLDGEPSAKYLTLESGRDGWRFEHHAVPYDVAATLRRFEETGYLEGGGPMTRLFAREIATGSHQVTPFMRYWRACVSDVADLATAIDRYLLAF